MDSPYKLVMFGFIVGILVTLSAFGGLRGCHRSEPKIVRDTTTIVKYDTLLIERPVEVRTVEVLRTDTVKLVDIRHDTVRVEVPISSHIYKDSSYTAQVSGYNAKLDWIELYPKTEYRTVYIESKPVVKPKRWGIGLNCGYGAGIVDGNVKFTPYIGVGLHYNIIRW